MFREPTVHHQEVRCTYVANGTSNMTASEPSLADSHLRSTICHINTPYLLMMDCWFPKHVEVSY
jgi:hypothetical protein